VMESRVLRSDGKFFVSLYDQLTHSHQHTALTSEYRKSFSTPTFSPLDENEEKQKENDVDREYRLNYSKEKLVSLLREEIETKFAFHTLQRGFLHIDKDRNGSLDPEELRDLIRNARCLNDVPKCSIDALIELCDVDRNGRITFEEFVRVIRGGADGFYSTPPMLPGPPLSKKNEDELAERMRKLKSKVRPKRSPPPYVPIVQKKDLTTNTVPARKTVATTSTPSCEDDPSFQDLLEGMVRWC